MKALDLICGLSHLVGLLIDLSHNQHLKQHEIEWKLADLIPSYKGQFSFRLPRWFPRLVRGLGHKAVC